MKNIYRDPAVICGADEVLARNMLARELANDEHLLWAGRPKLSWPIHPRGSGVFAFLLVWTLAVAAATIAMICELGIAGAVPVAPFLAFGLYGLVGHSLLEMRKRSRTFYGVTNLRALVVVMASERDLASIDLARTTILSMDESSDGTGTIWFDRWNIVVTTKKGARQPDPPAFRRITHAHDVFDCVRAVQASLQRDDRESDPPESEG